MSNYNFFLASTRGGLLRDLKFDQLCRELFREDEHGQVIFPEGSDLRVYRFLCHVWNHVRLQQWLATVDRHVSQDEINSEAFLRLVGWMYDEGLFRGHLKKCDVGHFLYLRAGSKLHRSEMNIISRLSMYVGKSKAGVLSYLLSICMSRGL